MSDLPDSARVSLLDLAVSHYTNQGLNIERHLHCLDEAVCTVVCAEARANQREMTTRERHNARSGTGQPTILLVRKDMHRVIVQASCSSLNSRNASNRGQMDTVV
jgi:hypothetical protein